MKGSYQRFMTRQTARTYGRTMDLYEKALDQLVKASGDGRPVRQDTRELNQTIRVGEVVAVKAQDRDHYYRTVLIKKIDFNNRHQAMISNPVYGEVPDGIKVVSQDQVFKRIRDLNAVTTETSLDAFPHFKIEGDI
tara:strand:+ start:885 stop:1292 length:408 start_codon:yes stop_codon:yes gene_type:complete